MDCSIPKLVDEIIRVGWQPKETARLLGIARDINNLYITCSDSYLEVHDRALTSGDTNMFIKGITWCRGKPEKLLIMRQALKAAAKGDVQDIPSVAHQVLLLCSQDHTAETLQV